MSKVRNHNQTSLYEKSTRAHGDSSRDNTNILTLNFKNMRKDKKGLVFPKHQMKRSYADVEWSQTGSPKMFQKPKFIDNGGSLTAGSRVRNKKVIGLPSSRLIVNTE